MPQPGNQYPYPPQHQQQHQHQQQAYVDDRRSMPPGYAAQPPQPVPVARSEPPQPQHSQHVPHPPMPHISPPPQPTQERRPQEPQPPPPVEPNTDRSDRLQVRTTVDTAIKKLPQRKSHSIFTPIEENRSILSQHLASFASEPQAIKMEHSIKSEAGSGLSTNRSQSVEASGLRSGLTSSPPPKREGTQSSLDRTRNASVSSSAEDAFTPPSRANSLTRPLHRRRRRSVRTRTLQSSCLRLRRRLQLYYQRALPDRQIRLLARRRSRALTAKRPSQHCRRVSSTTNFSQALAASIRTGTFAAATATPCRAR